MLAPSAPAFSQIRRQDSGDQGSAALASQRRNSAGSASKSCIGSPGRRRRLSPVAPRFIPGRGTRSRRVSTLVHSVNQAGQPIVTIMGEMTGAFGAEG